jgi:hypothetical protein
MEINGEDNPVIRSIEDISIKSRVFFILVSIREEIRSSKYSQSEDHSKVCGPVKVYKCCGPKLTKNFSCFTQNLNYQVYRR